MPTFCSMSVEETNRVRAMLGLKPLNVGGASGGKPTAEEVMSWKRKNAYLQMAFKKHAEYLLSKAVREIHC